MNHVKHPKHLEKTNRNLIHNCLFALSLLALCICIASFRLPETSGSRSIRLTRNLNIPKNHSGGKTELRILETGTRGDYPAAERTGSPRGAVDLGRLARAVAIAETSGGTRGVALTHNNHHGLRENSDWIRFDSPAASTACFKRNWLKHYGNHFPTIEDAEKYTGNDRKETWLKNVRANY